MSEPRVVEEPIEAWRVWRFAYDFVNKRYLLRAVTQNHVWESPVVGPVEVADWTPRSLSWRGFHSSATYKKACSDAVREGGIVGKVRIWGEGSKRFSEGYLSNYQQILELERVVFCEDKCGQKAKYIEDRTVLPGAQELKHPQHTAAVCRHCRRNFPAAGWMKLRPVLEELATFYGVELVRGRGLLGLTFQSVMKRIRQHAVSFFSLPRWLKPRAIKHGGRHCKCSLRCAKRDAILVCIGNFHTAHLMMGRGDLIQGLKPEYASPQWSTLDEVLKASGPDKDTETE